VRRPALAPRAPRAAPWFVTALRVPGERGADR